MSKELRLKAAEVTRDLTLASAEMNYRIEVYVLEGTLFHPRELRASIRRYFQAEEAARTCGIYLKEEISGQVRTLLLAIEQIVNECYG